MSGHQSRAYAKEVWRSTPLNTGIGADLRKIFRGLVHSMRRERDDRGAAGAEGGGPLKVKVKGPAFIYRRLHVGNQNSSGLQCEVAY